MEVEQVGPVVLAAGDGAEGVAGLLRELDLTAEEKALAATLEPERLPRHIAFIMDGNGRWARDRSRPRIFGHRIARNTVRMVIKTCDCLGIRDVTLYTFSTENWRRPDREVSALMALLRTTLLREKTELYERNVRLDVLGDLEGLPEPAQRELDDSVRLMKDNTGLRLHLAVNYGGRNEIVSAVKSLAQEVREGRLEPQQITAKDLSDRLYTRGIPDPELLVRTGGEHRISNFLLWQLAYTELWVTPVLWPDFSRAHLLMALRDYQKRDRRFGGL